MTSTLGVGFGDGQVSYVAAIQDLLGNQGASLTLGGSAAAPTATLYGSANAKVGTSVEPAVTVTLSAQAQHFLSNDQIALDVLTGKPGAKVPTITLPTQTTQATAPAVAATPTGPGGTAGAIAGIIAQAKAEVSDPNFIYNVANPSNHYYGIIDGLADSAKAGFVQAFNNHTLTIQNVTDVQGLSYVDQTQLTGTSQTGAYSFNESTWNNLSAAHDGNITIAGTPLGGALILSWGSSTPPASGADGGSAAAVG